MYSLNGKAAIVTGGGSGLGEAIALELAREGAKVAVIGRTLAKLEKTVSKMNELSTEKHMAVTADVTKIDSVTAAFEKIFKEYGRIDILVNNAGIIVRKSVLEHPVEEWEECIATNLTGTFICSKAVAPYMIEQKDGNIVNISSIAGIRGHYVSYAASKAGIVNLTRALANDLAQYGINVNCISPGLIVTDLNRALLEQEEINRNILKKTPQKRLGTPEDVAKTVVFLSSESSDFINGENIVLDGGMTSTLHNLFG